MGMVRWAGLRATFRVEAAAALLWMVVGWAFGREALVFLAACEVWGVGGRVQAACWVLLGAEVALRRGVAFGNSQRKE